VPSINPSQYFRGGKQGNHAITEKAKPQMPSRVITRMQKRRDMVPGCWKMRRYWNPRDSLMNAVADAYEALMT